MALPTTGLTFHINASVDTDLWKNNTAGVFTNHPADGEHANFADCVEHTLICATNGGVAPIWRQGTPLMELPCLDFNGTDENYLGAVSATGASVAMSSLISASAFTVLASFYAEAIGTNAANPYDNDAILADAGGFWGIHLKTGKAVFYNYDGSADSIELAISTATSYVVMFRHEGGSIYASLDGGSETSAASGNTGDLTGRLQIGRNFGSSNKFYNGRLGELAIYNTALTGSDLTDGISYMTGRWLPAAPSGFVPFPHPRGESGGIQKLTGGLNE